MNVVASLMYAAGAVAILAVILECCCRRALRQYRDAPHLASLNGVNMNNVPYPVEAPYPVAPTGVGPEGTVFCPAVPVAVHVDVDQDCFFQSYAPTTPATQHNETPPPSYEQVMASPLSNFNKSHPV